MSYLTVSEFRDRFVDRDLDAILDDIGDTSAQNTYLTTRIAEAGRELDARASGRYRLPLAADEQVADLTAQIAWFKVLRRKTFNMTDGDRKDEEILRQTLRDIADRKFHLTGQSPAGSVDSATNARETSPSARVKGTARQFHSGSLKGF